MFLSRRAGQIWFLVLVGFVVGNARLAYADATLTGTWQGDVVQSIARFYSTGMQITDPGPGKCGIIEYPQLACGGELYDCIEQEDGGYRALERINLGQERCVDGGTIHFRLSGDSLGWAWFYPDGRVGATATLSRMQATVFPAAAEPANPSWHQTSSGCKWWGTLVSRYSDMMWTGECREGLVHGKGQFEYQDSAGRNVADPPSYFYRGLKIANDSYFTSKFGHFDERCFALYESNAYWISPIERAWLPHRVRSRYDLWRAGSYVGNINLNYMMRYVTKLAYQGYNFHIWFSYSLFNWCNHPAFGSEITLGSPEFVFISTDDEISDDRLFDERFVSMLMETFRQAARHADANTKHKSNNVSSLDSVILIGRLGPTYRVLINNEINYPLQEKLRKEQEKKQQEEKLKQVNSKRAFDAFVQEHGISTWPNHDQLYRNPFNPESQVIGLVVSFESMIDREVALFISDSGKIFAVEHVPTTGFRGRERVLLAARVKGIEDIRTQSGDQRVVQLAYVGSHICVEPKCADMLSWDQ